MLSAIFTKDRTIKILKKIDLLVVFSLCISFFCVLLVYLNQEVFDLDIWLHIKTGEQILLNKQIFLNDIYSFTKNGTTWINHEWLYQVASFIVYSLFGFDGIIGLQAIVFILIFLLIVKFAYRNRNFLLITLGLFMLLLNVSYRFSFRPDMFSILFLVIYLYLFLKNSKYIRIIPFLQVIWSNIHGFFFLGIIVIFCFAIFDRLNRIDKSKKYAKLVLFSLIATLVNPQFVKGAIYPLVTLLSLSQDRFVFTFIQELRKPFSSIGEIFDISTFIYLKALAIISLFTFRFNQKRTNFPLLVLWVLSLIAGLAAIRNIAYFAFISIMAIFYNINSRLSNDQTFYEKFFLKGRHFYFARYLFICLLVFCMQGNAKKLTNGFYYDYDNYSFKSCFWGASLRVYPKKAADFLINENLPPRIFNNFNSGSYIVGRAFPMRKVFIDGRTEFYGTNFLREYKIASDGDKEVLDKIIKRYAIQGFFLSMTLSHFDYELAKVLFKDDHWKVIYFDADAIIFIKNTEENKKIINDNLVDLKKWKAPELDFFKIGTHILEPFLYLRRGEVLFELECYEAAITEARGALKLDPGAAEPYEIIGKSYFKLERFNEAAENLRLALAISPSNNDLRNKYAISLFNMKLYEEAEKQFLNLKKKTPKDPQIYYWLSQIYEKLNKLTESENAIKKANEYSKNKNLEYLNRWIKILKDLKKKNQVKQVYDLALKLSPGNVQIEKEIENLDKNSL